MSIRAVVLFFLWSLPILAQQGDRPGETQSPPAITAVVPPAPPLSPADALKTFKLPEGFRIELVASEPMVEEPVALTFDPEGRLWVLEMRGFMPNVDGQGELEPVGRISVLEDLDGDGQIDKSTVFLDGLVMARAICLVRDGLLVAEPPKLLFCRDTDGDLKCDEKTVVANDYATQADPKLGARANHEHASNGLMVGLDNWIYSANHTTRFRWTDEDWLREPTIFRGQWGLTQDDFGRLIYNSNSDQLRGDLVPAHYLSRNPNFRNASGANVQFVKDQSTWPIRPNTGVNRGYQKGQLRADGTLATFTGACGPVIYRGDNFPEEFRGNAFLCEPTANFIRRNILSEKDCAISAKNAYEKSEFLASTDERFRPVNLYNAPDGTLYIVDMYHGVLQHRIYLTSYLRQQYLSRGLDQPIHLGRIYRVVHGAKKPGPKPSLTKAESKELVALLSHANGWHRDTAQRLLIERAAHSAASELKRLAAASTKPLAQLHALWTLEGLGHLDLGTLDSAMKSAHPKVRATAIRLAELMLKSESMQEKTLQVLKPLLDDQACEVQVQLAYSLGEIRNPAGDTLLALIARTAADSQLVRDAILTGLYGRELDFLTQLLADKIWATPAPGRGSFLGGLSRAILTERKVERVNRLLELLIASGSDWQKTALLEGAIATMPVASRNRPAPKIKVLRFSAEPPALQKLLDSDNSRIRELARKLEPLLVWPGKPGVPPEPPVPALSAQQQNRFEAGQELFTTACAVCHQPHGLGQDGLAPPLVDSEWVLGSEQRLARIILHGVRGPITVLGRTYDLDMPAFGVFDDEQIAALLTYLRREWEHTASPVEPSMVGQIRRATASRQEPWTEPELLKIP
ncbi:MAG: c-type cytochrome [Verrucomicrobiota bacterium]